MATQLIKGGRIILKSGLKSLRRGLIPKSHALSRYGRNLVEHQSLRVGFGLVLAAITLFFNLFTPPQITADQSDPVLEVITFSPSLLKLTTTATIRAPLAQVNLSQKFHSGHLGIDLQAPQGTPIYPMFAGKVSMVRYQRFAYGNHLIIDHGQGVQSLYAHLSQIYVKPADQVTTDSIIGLVGETGKATGPHLHLEVIDQGRQINPLSLMQPSVPERK